MKHRPLPRRTFLAGMGAMLPLPFLEIMTPSIARPATAVPAAAAPPRYIWLYQGCGFFPDTWNPQGEGRQFTLPRVLQPFGPFKDRMTVIRNLTTEAYGPHIGKCSALLTGRQAEREFGVFANGKSVDQHVADRIGGETLLRSLELGVEFPGQGYCSGANTPVSYGATISWSTPTTRLMPEVTPRAAFDLLFRKHAGPEAKARARWQQSILDSVSEQATSMHRQASSADRQKLDEYLDSVRTLEKRIQRAVEPPKKGWVPATQPPESEFQPPLPGVPADRREHVRQMLDVLTLALWTDSTRVATMMFANSLSEGDFRFLPAVNSPFHEGCSHHQNQADKIEAYVQINEWHAEQAAYLLKRLDSIDEGDGSLLDHSAIFFGGSLKDGNEHTNIDLPVAMFGSLGGRVKPAGHIFAREKTNIANLHLTTLGWFDIEADNFNLMSTGTIPELS